jgi:hypothetical protein
MYSTPGPTVGPGGEGEIFLHFGISLRRSDRSVGPEEIDISLRRSDRSVGPEERVKERESKRERERRLENGKTEWLVLVLFLLKVTPFLPSSPPAVFLEIHIPSTLSVKGGENDDRVH